MLEKSQRKRGGVAEGREEQARWGVLDRKILPCQEEAIVEDVHDGDLEEILERPSKLRRRE